VITWIPGALPLPASHVSRNARAHTASDRCEPAASRLHATPCGTRPCARLCPAVTRRPSRDPRIPPVWRSLRYVTRRHLFTPVVISRSPTHQRVRHTCPPARHLGHCPRSTYAAAAPHLAQPQLKTCSFPRFSCTRKRINLSRTKCELAVVKFDLLMCV
jgi:hypothetical protein